MSETECASYSDLAVERAKAYMRERLGEHIAVDDLAHTALFSKFHFTRVFHRVTGMSPGRYLAEMRVQEAMRLLRGTDMKVIDITYAVGYASVGTFSSRFRVRVGVSPTEYRRRCHQLPDGYDAAAALPAAA
jgi:transcriptional regulator GlxA family with amidase domain